MGASHSNEMRPFSTGLLQISRFMKELVNRYDENKAKSSVGSFTHEVSHENAQCRESISFYLAPAHVPPRRMPSRHSFCHRRLRSLVR